VLITHDIVRASIFLIVFLLMAGWECIAPRRSPSLDRRQRWPVNLELALLSALLVRFIAPLTVVGVAVAGQSNGWGLMNVVNLPAWIVAITTFVALDLVIFCQHLVFHRVAILWRLHRVHHADMEFDVTTGLRFHPGEVVISLLVKILAVLALGVPPLVVLCFEVVLNATSMFNHGNVRLPLSTDALLRKFLVTPDMHRVHHSTETFEMNSNFGFNFSFWDRLFRTYRAQPAGGHIAMPLGIVEFHTAADLTLGRLLRQPWL
jgi:sterol desaturase/sphingolipid hydroxylase (fatty acid hydroxylase superfamily)